MNKKILVLCSLLVATGLCAKKRSKKEVKQKTGSHAPREKNKLPLRGIARELESGRTLTNKEQAIFLEHDMEQTSDEVGMIRYTITVFKDKDRYSMGDWDCATRNTVNQFKFMNDQDANWVDDMVFEIHELLLKAFDPQARRTGIHAEVKVQMSSGKKPRDCKCGDSCECAKRYAGNCPCSLETPKAHPAEVTVGSMDRKK